MGSGAALETMARRWRPKLIAHAWRLLGDAESAKDAAQVGWVEIIRGLATLKDERAFPAWAFRIVSRRCARQIAARRRTRALEAAVAAEPESAAEPPPDGTDIDRLRWAIRALPREQRAAIAL